MQGGFMGRLTSEKENFKLSNLKKEDLARLYFYLRPYKLQFIQSFFCMIFVSALTLLFPYIIKIAIDNYILENNIIGLTFLGIFFLFLQFLHWTGNYIQSYLSGWIGQKLICHIRSDLYSHILMHSMAFHHKKRKGELVSRVIHDTNSLSELISSGIINAVNDFVVIMGSLAVMFCLDFELTLLSLVTLPFIYLTTKYLGQKINKAYREAREKTAELNADVQENISGIRAIQSMNTEDRNIEQFEQTNVGNMRANLKALMLFSLFFPVTTLSNTIGTAVVLWYGGHALINETITAGTFMAFLSYMNLFFRPLRDLSQIYGIYQSSAASFFRITEYLKMPYEIEETNNPQMPAGGFNGNIEFKDVSFGYSEEKVLKEINLKICSGEKIAVIGESGTGKTTLVNLLLRLFDVNSGEIKIDGINIKDISFDNLRKMISVVPQDIFLFSGTIRENIEYGKPGASEEEIIKAARLTHAHDFIIQLPKGYDTETGEEGHLLSGGQKQLIAFARAVIADPLIIILDEATSSVDSHTEELIRKAMESILSNRTAIMIAHRFSTIRKAERILVIEAGRISHEGNHENLMKSSSIYQKLYKNQYQISY